MSNIPIFICPEQNKLGQTWKLCEFFLTPPGVNRLSSLNSRLSYEYWGQQCDYCGGFNQELKGYRCAGCKTKVYCGDECHIKDKEHLELCESVKVREEERARKKKKGKKGRKLITKKMKTT